MLKDKGEIVEITMPAMSSTNTSTISIASLLGVSEGVAASVKGFLLSGTNVTLSEKKVGGKMCFRLTATGSVSANAKAYIYAQVVGSMAKAVISAKDA